MLTRLFSALFLCALLDISECSDYVYYESVQAAYKFYREPLDWFTARAICSTEGATLAMPRDEAEKDILIEIFNEYPADDLYDVTEKDSLLLGFHDLFTEGDHRTLKDISISYYYNNRTHSTSIDELDCGSLHRSGSIEEISCNNPGVFVCEKSNTTRSVIPQDNRCKTKGYAHAEGLNKCYKIHTNTKTWFDAKDACRHEDGSLAIITNEKEATYLTQLLFDTLNLISFSKYENYERPYAFLGFHDMFKEGRYITLDDINLYSVGYHNWETGELTGSYYRDSKDCGAMSFNGKLKEVACTDPAKYICEQPALVLQMGVS